VLLDDDDDNDDETQFLVTVGRNNSVGERARKMTAQDED
jgi:hypothetical protein